MVEDSSGQDDLVNGGFVEADEVEGSQAIDNLGEGVQENLVEADEV